VDRCSWVAAALVAIGIIGLAFAWLLFFRWQLLVPTVTPLVILVAGWIVAAAIRTQLRAFPVDYSVARLFRANLGSTAGSRSVEAS
jgi:hypothetical protein